MSAAALQPVRQIEINPLSAHIGAEIHGVDLTQKLDSHQVAQIRDALLKWRVVFFREQFLTHEQHVAFSAQFGELTLGHPVFGHVDGHREIYSISKFRKATRFEGPSLLRPCEQRVRCRQRRAGTGLPAATEPSARRSHSDGRDTR